MGKIFDQFTNVVSSLGQAILTGARAEARVKELEQVCERQAKSLRTFIDNQRWLSGCTNPGCSVCREQVEAITGAKGALDAYEAAKAAKAAKAARGG